MITTAAIATRRAAGRRRATGVVATGWGAFTLGARTIRPRRRTGSCLVRRARDARDVVMFVNHERPLRQRELQGARRWSPAGSWRPSWSPAAARTVEPSSGPSTAPIAVGPTAATGPGSWASADVVQPDVVTQAPSLEPGYHCSPCHPGRGEPAVRDRADGGRLRRGWRPAAARRGDPAGGRPTASAGSPTRPGPRPREPPPSRPPPTGHGRSSWAAALPAPPRGPGRTGRGRRPIQPAWPARRAPRR